MSFLLAETIPFTAPTFDFHAFAPEIILVTVLAVALLVDLFVDDAGAIVASLTSWGFLGALIPLVTLAVAGDTGELFGGAYMVDNYALVLKALFLISGYLVTLLSLNYIGEGDYWESEYYLLLIASVLGMTIMASSRDLISMFIALETLSIPAYMLAAWRKRDLKSDEAGMKYYLMGVFASAVMLYGMSLLYGLTGTTLLAGIADQLRGPPQPVITLAIVFVLIGFGFKVSAVPFHQWAPDTYEGAPTPVTAFLAVASKAAGFVALMTLLFICFQYRSDIVQPFMWGLAVVTMFVGNFIALRQTNVVRMLAYSGIAQAGYILAPLAVLAPTAGTRDDVLSAVLTYLVIYVVMNLGAFAVVMAVARKTRSAEVTSFGGLFSYAPGLAFAMTIFLFSLAGIPPLGGWFAKFGVFSALVAPNTTSGYVLAVLVGVNSVIALFYYARVAKTMWMDPVPDGDTTPISVPPALRSALIITAVITLAMGVYPGIVTHFSDSPSRCQTAAAPERSPSAITGC